MVILSVVGPSEGPEGGVGSRTESDKENQCQLLGGIKLWRT
jgi:hypothetical protein